MDFHARGKPKKEHSIRNTSFINMRGGMKSRLNKSNKKEILYKKWDNYRAAHVPEWHASFCISTLFYQHA